jgi:hypothetical protein
MVAVEHLLSRTTFSILPVSRWELTVVPIHGITTINIIRRDPQAHMI